MLFGCPENVTITTFGGPHLRLSFKCDSTACPLPNCPQTSTLNSPNVDVYFHYLFWYLCEPLFQRFCLPDGPQNDCVF